MPTLETPPNVTASPLSYPLTQARLDYLTTPVKPHGQSFLKWLNRVLIRPDLYTAELVKEQIDRLGAEIVSQIRHLQGLYPEQGAEWMQGRIKLAKLEGQRDGLTEALNMRAGRERTTSAGATSRPGSAVSTFTRDPEPDPFR